MKMRSHALSIILCLVTAAAGQPARGESIKDIEKRMNAAAAEFKSMTADIIWISHTEVLNEDSKETGSVVLRRTGSGEIQGLVEFVTPDRKFVHLEKQSLQIFYPKTKVLDVYELGDQADQVYQFLMIGFGTSGTALAKDYDMKVLGNEPPRGQQGVPTVRLQLIPRSPKLRDNYVSKMELWIREQGDPYPIQEKISEAKSGNYRIVAYSDLKINPPMLKPDATKLNLPAGVKTEKHSGK